MNSSAWPTVSTDVRVDRARGPRRSMRPPRMRERPHAHQDRPGVARRRRASTCASFARPERSFPRAVGTSSGTPCPRRPARRSPAMRRMLFSLWYWVPGRRRWDTGITPPELVRFVAVSPPGRALDLGCGTGTNVVYLTQHGWDAVGVDFAARAVAKARERARRAGVASTFFVGDVTRLGFLGR